MLKVLPDISLSTVVRLELTRLAESVVIAATVILATAIALYSLYVLLIGRPWIVVPETAAVNAAGPSIQLIPDRAVMVSLVASAAVVGGLVTRKLPIAWIGMAVLFVFGFGGTLLPGSVGLLTSLIVITVMRRRRRATDDELG